MSLEELQKSLKIIMTPEQVKTISSTNLNKNLHPLSKIEKFYTSQNRSIDYLGSPGEDTYVPLT